MKKVLIVDDEKDIVESVGSFLTKQGFSVFSALDGEEAKAKIVEVEPDIVLLDLILPKANGFEVLKWLRENFEQRTPVIIFSIKDKLEDIKKGYSFDADFYLPKPFTNHQLLQSIKTVLSLSNYRQT